MRLPDTNVNTLVASGYGALAVAITLLAFTKPVIAVGAAFAVVALMLTWRRPEIALMLIVAVAPFQKDLGGSNRDIVGSASTGIAFSIAELLFAAALPAFLLNCLAQRRRLILGPIAVPVLLYFTICVGSSMLNWRGPSTAISLAQIFLYLVLAVMSFASFPKKPVDLELALYAVVCVGTFLSIMTLIGMLSHLGLNKNGTGASLGTAMLVCTELWFAAKTQRRKVQLAWALGIIAAGLVFSLSRGAWIGALAGLMVILGLRREFTLLLKVGVVMAIVVAILWQFVPEDKKEYAFDFSSTRYSIHARYESIDLAQRYFEKSPIWGVGVGLRKQVDATNVFWFTLAETGILGLVTFLLIHAVFFRMVWITQKRIPHTDIRYSLVALGAALVLSKFGHGMVDHYWTRGHLLVAWAAAGMATGVYHTSKPRDAALQEAA